MQIMVSKVADNFPVGCFEKLKHNVHFIDTSTHSPKDAPGRDRPAKMRPLIDTINEQLLLVALEEHLSIDGQIIPFKGRSSLSQYCLKPMKRGHNVCVLSSVSHFYKLEVYTVHENLAQRLLGEPHCGASGSVVVRLSRAIPRGVYHKVHFDNYFNGQSLQVYLEKESVHCIGTERINWVHGANLPGEPEMKKRGEDT